MASKKRRPYHVQGITSGRITDHVSITSALVAAWKRAKPGKGDQSNSAYVSLGRNVIGLVRRHRQ